MVSVVMFNILTLNSKNDIERMLVAYFGRNNVIRKNKCIHIQENTYRTEIDVVPTWEHRTYIGENNDPYNFYRGVKLWSDDGEEVIITNNTKNNGINKNTQKNDIKDWCVFKKMSILRWRILVL